MSLAPLLKPSCMSCIATTNLYRSNCKHLLLCFRCGKNLVENQHPCSRCGIVVTRLIQEYDVRLCSNKDKNNFIGKFDASLPNFSKDKSSENQWTLQKEGLLGRQVTDTMREEHKNDPWILEDEMSQSQYHGQLEGALQGTYYVLTKKGKHFVATPAGPWYNFKKVTQYKQFTLKEAEEKMKNKRRTADGYERWMMKAANNGPAAFGESNKVLDIEVGSSSSGGRGHKDEEGNASDKENEDEDEAEDEAEAEETARKYRLGVNKKGVYDDGEGRRGGDFDDDDDIDIEKGDYWEHDEMFTDDDEAVGNNPEEREDLAPDVPVPPEIKQDDDAEEEDESNEEERGGLSKSGKELKMLLELRKGMNDSDGEDDDDYSDDLEDEDGTSAVLVPKVEEGPKEEPSTSKSSKGKRKIYGDDTVDASSALKQVKIEDEQNEEASAPKGSPSSSSQGPVSEDEIRAVLLQRAPVTSKDLLSCFEGRLRSRKDKEAFSATMKGIATIIKTKRKRFIVLKDT